MSLDTAKKEPLNRITHSVRSSQAVLQYGVGAMVDFPDQTLMTAAPEYWEERIVQIHDERLEKVLHVDYFGMPGSKDEKKFQEGISYARFPEWYFCPKCRKFQPINKWIKEYRRKAKDSIIDKDPNMVKHMQCPTCKQDLVVTRIITVCEHGHIDDFPWVKWAHYKNLAGSKEICTNPILNFKTGTSASEGLEGLVITCETCKSKANLKDAFDKEIFSKLDEKTSKSEFACSGRHPWKHTKEHCGIYPRAMQRGSSSVYFPMTASSLVIPPYSDILTKKIEDCIAFRECKTTIANLTKMVGITSDIKEQIVKGQIEISTDKISLEIGANKEQIIAILNRKWFSAKEEEYSAISVKYRAEEYAALSGEIYLDANYSGDFLRESTDIIDYCLPNLLKVSLIHKVREVQALTGFTRLKPAERSEITLQVPNLVSIKEESTNWYPAYEVKGEGIFIEIDQEKINIWAKGNTELQRRVDELNDNYLKSFIGSNNPRIITGKFLLLHTLSHLLIKQLSFECGYSITSLKERIYCSEANEGKEMAGILIYTASGDSEGTMGGLVRQGRPDSFRKLFIKAIESATSCSNDPVCIFSKGQGRDSLNLAACHSCTLIPETSCEEYNIFLDRGVVVGTFENNALGFYCNQLYDRNVGWNYLQTEPTLSNFKSDDYSRDKKVLILCDSGVDLSNMTYEAIWHEVKKWSSDIKEIDTLEELILKNDLFDMCEKPIFDGNLKLLNDNTIIQCDLIWKKSKVLLFMNENKAYYELSKNTDWRCYIISENTFSAESLISAIKGGIYGNNDS